MSKLQIWLGLLVSVLALCSLAAPFALAILFPEVAPAIADISNSAYAWIVILFLFAMFSRGIRDILAELAKSISKVKTFSAGGLSADLDRQGSVQLTPEQAEEVRNRFNTLDQQSQSSLDLARTYFLKFIFATIYRSQFELLNDLLNSGPKTTQQILNYYQKFRERSPEDTEYTVGEWLEYLTANLLIQQREQQDAYELTEAGKLFLQRFNDEGHDSSRLIY